MDLGSLYIVLQQFMIKMTPRLSCICLIEYEFYRLNIGLL